MKPRQLEVGEIVQVNPTWTDGLNGHRFGGCLMIVTASRPWGAIGYVQPPGNAGQVFYRCAFHNMEPTGGRACWSLHLVAAEQDQADDD